MRREYNGLTGQEILELFLIETRDILSREGRLSPSQVYHNVTLRLDLELDSYPHEPKVEKFAVSQKIGGEPPKASPVKRDKVKREKKIEVPDLARDEIDDAKKAAQKAAAEFAPAGSSIDAVMSA